MTDASSLPLVGAGLILRDSELLLLASHHLSEASKLAFCHDYGDGFHRHMDRVKEMSDWLNSLADQRKQSETPNNSQHGLNL